MGTIRPILFVTSGAGIIKGDGLEVRDFRPRPADSDLQVKGITALPAAETTVSAESTASAEEESDPKDPNSSAIESASDSGSEISEKLTPESETVSSPELNPIPPLALSGAAVSAAKVKSQHPASESGGKIKPPAAE